jgi:hypothetical protein
VDALCNSCTALLNRRDYRNENVTRRGQNIAMNRTAAWMWSTMPMCGTV